MEWKVRFTDDGYILLNMDDGKGFIISHALPHDEAWELGKKLIQTVLRAERKDEESC